MVAAVVAYQGWGSSAQAWGAGVWGTDAASNLPIATAAIGNESVSTERSHVQAVTGIAGTTSAGTALGQGGVITSVTGLLATATAMGGDEEHVWSEIVTSQTPSWGSISTSQTPSWGDIST